MNLTTNLLKRYTRVKMFCEEMTFVVLLAKKTKPTLYYSYTIGCILSWKICFFLLRFFYGSFLLSKLLYKYASRKFI